MEQTSYSKLSQRDVDLDELTEFAKTVPNWTTFKEWVSERIREAQEELPY